MAEHNDWGKVAEQIAAEHLIKQGYVVRERNWQPMHGHVEIDIISQKDNVLIFIEVKARQSEDYDPADAVDDKKIRKLVRAAESYLRSQEYDFEYRFDIITVIGNEEQFTLDHIEDAFLPPLS
ncbi:MAG: YraN family protein [Muribaculaceae bacterium]|nr:YraN family protein [Muribaculaceae bacterium]